MNDFSRLQQDLVRFRDERDWKQFHTLKNLIVSLNLEAAEVLELIQWKSDAEMEALQGDPAFRARLEDECADVLLYLLQVCEAGGIDLLPAARAKMAKNALRYPVERAWGSAAKAEDAPREDGREHDAGRAMATAAVTLSTPRLLLRDFVPGDLPAYRALQDDPAFRRLYGEDEVGGERSAQLLRMFMDQAAERPRTRYQFAVTMAGSGELIGSCGVRMEGGGQASFGIELGVPWQGRGLATEAARAVIGFGFRTLGAHRIHAETLSENAAAIALCRRLGMRVEGEFRDHRFFGGRWWNTTIIALLSSEWQ